MDVKGLVKAGLENTERPVDRTLKGLTLAGLNWHPRLDANSIGLILFHMARFEDSLVRSPIQGKPQFWETRKCYQKLNKAKNDSGNHHTEEQCATFIVPQLKDLQSYSDAVRKQTVEYLKDMTPEKLAKKVDLPPMSHPPKDAPENERGGRHHCFTRLFS